MKRRFLLVQAFILCLLAQLSAQNIEKTQEQLTNFANLYPQEKLHIHTDRNVYGVGETIWYKLYNVVGWENNLSVLSNIGYVELISPAGEVVAKKVNAIFSGIGVGEIELVDSLVEGSYRMRSYTNWMKNSDPDYFFEKVINIGNVRSDNVMTNTTTITEEGVTYYVVELSNLSETAWPKTAVTYQFTDNGKVVDKGKENLDSKGQIRIKVTEKNKGKDLTLSFNNPEKRPVKKQITTKAYFSENSIQVFAEGGHVIGDELNKIAFKALNPQGKGIKAKVYLLSSAKDTIASIETNELGMGSAPCYIAKDGQYSVLAKFADNSEKSIPFPQITTSGYGISINQSNSSKLFAQVNLTEDKINSEDLYIVAQHLGHVFYIAKQKASNKNVLFTLPKEKLPSGVFTLSVMNKDFNPLLERVVFHLAKERIMPMQTKLDKPTYGKRSKVTSEIEVGNAEDTVKLAAISASVINLTKYGKDLTDDVSMLSSLLLSSNIKGFLEKPAYYFNEDGSVKTTELDNLLMTQAWRKIVWTTLDSLNKEPKYAPEKGINIAGYARKIGRKAPVPNAKIQLVPTHNFMDYIDTMANEEGKFVFNDLVFPDSIKFLISAKDEKGKNNIDITLVPEDNPEVNYERNRPLILNDINTKFRDQLLAGKKFYQQLENKGLMDKVNEIEEIVVTATRPKAAENSANMNGPGNADQVLSADDLSTCSSLEMCLNGRLTGVLFSQGKALNTRGMGEMQIILDGMYVEADMLGSIVPQDVQSVEVLRNVNYTTIYGSNGANGLIIITSKTGRDASRGNSKPKGLLSIQPKGISILREFFKPAYEAESTNQFDIDLRTTIHWEPGIVTDEHGKASFNFYTSDEIGTYRITIEGIDFEGRLIRKLIDFEVK
ncbi:hypothetical protein ACFRAE_05870 [Sphingobacterium sp. HJSM2_6]|uniref:hypothetical protein n=1 Tax=Sphingobacterium sp. HJSM2_6 TaxID=3366264 RepID=UPI003BDDDB11